MSKLKEINPIKYGVSEGTMRCIGRLSTELSDIRDTIEDKELSAKLWHIEWDLSMIQTIIMTQEL